MSDRVKIWGRTTSINVQKALIALDECGVEYDQETIGRQHGGTHEDWYRKINPNGIIPTIKDGDFVLWESNAIVAYVCEKYGMGDLCPNDVHQRALCHQWMAWQITTAYPHLLPIFLNTMRPAEYKGGQALVDAAPGNMAKALDILNVELAGQEYLVGDNFTMADIPIGLTVKRWYLLQEKDASHGNVHFWQDRLNQRQSFIDHANLPLE